MEDDSFSQLLSAINDPNITTEELISNDQFQAAMKKEYPPLIDFLKKEKTIRDLAKWCFDPTLVKDSRFKKISSIAIFILTSTMPSIFQIFVKSHILATVIHDFLLTDASTYPMQCGFLSRIISQQIRWSEPIVFKDFPDISVLLVKNIASIAIQDIVVTISAREQIPLYTEMNIILLLSEIMISEMNESAAAVLQQIYDNINDDSPLISQYCNSQVISNIVNFCLSSKWIVLSLDLLEVAVHIVENNMELFPIIEKHQNILEIRKDNINVFSVMMIPLFVHDVIDLFTLFFEPDAYKYLHHHCSALVLELTTEEILRLSQIPNFIDHLIDIYGTEHWCHHMMELSVIFTRVLPYYKTDLDPKWSNFFGSYGKNIVRILQESYGGPVPDINIADKIMNDLLESQFQEEEEEEEEEIEEEEHLPKENSQVKNQNEPENILDHNSLNQNDTISCHSSLNDTEHISDHKSLNQNDNISDHSSLNGTEHISGHNSLSQNENISDHNSLNDTESVSDHNSLNLSSNNVIEDNLMINNENFQRESDVNQNEIKNEIENSPQSELNNETETQQGNKGEEEEEEDYEEEEYEKITIVHGDHQYVIRGIVCTNSDISSEDNDSDEDIEFDTDDD